MSSNQNRLARGGRINRSAPINFTFNDKTISGLEGDSLASALLAANVSLVARSFKYHRPRGIYSAGVEEPNALVTLGEGGQQEPNCAATTTRLRNGLVAQSQNHWPTLETDFMSFNNWLSPLFSAGFYYKTFMGPTRKAWGFYEHIIRRAAGMGTSSVEADPDRYEKANDNCDLLVIGAGPAGITAALCAASNGEKVILVEQQAELGGSLLDESVESNFESWRLSQLAKLNEFTNITILCRTTAFGAYDHGTFGLIEQVNANTESSSKQQPRLRYWKVRTQKTILATGMIERPMVFENNDLPGIMLASAVRSYVNRYSVLPGKVATIYTNNDTAYETASTLAAASAFVEILDTRTTIPDSCRALAQSENIRTRTGCTLIKAQGGKKIEALSFLSEDNATIKTLKTDLLCLSGGWTPTLHIWSQRGRKPTYNHQNGCFLPDAEVDNIVCVGACAGHFVSADVTHHAQAAGIAVKNNDTHTADSKNQYDPEISPLPSWPSENWAGTIGSLFAGDISQLKVSKKSFIDLQHDVTARDVCQSYSEGYESVEHTKRYTTLGMAADQGKTSNVNGLALIAKLRGFSIPEVGTTTFRPPYSAVPIGAFAGNEFGEYFQPTRLSPMHDWHNEHGAKQTQAGLWLRAWYYPKTNESLDDAYKREATHVRSNAGLVDVSSLGKILVQGPDAAEFLERVYTNGWKGLKIGRVRYGIMLRDDGIIMDDGTTARLAEDEFFMTTTTANASVVMSHLEFLLQTCWKNLRVRVTSVTDQWAGMAIAGPNSRNILQQAVTDCDLSDQGLPHMGLVYGLINGTPIRIHRMSFSGELAYEVFVAAGYGHSIWQSLIDAGTPIGLKPYGTEALAALRIEKGHAAGPELDGRTTLPDLGLQGLASSKKPYIGKALAARPGICAPDRPQLVGLETLQSKDRIKSGSILFAESATRTGHGEGHVTSTSYSVSLHKNIALGLLSNGGQRIDEHIICSNPIEGQEITVKVVSPQFYDSEGTKLHV